MSAVNPPERDAQRLGKEVYQGVAKQSAGYKMLASMGWAEGQGLGAKKQGIKEHVKVKKKHDAMGVGAMEQDTHGRDWTVGMMGFDKILSGLKEVTAKHDTDSGSSSSESESEAEKPTAPTKRKKEDKASTKNGKAAPTKKAANKKSAKAETPESSSSSSDGSASSSSDSSDSEDEAPSKPTGKVATHVGRYQKRERGKMVKGYSAQDLAAILGVGEGNGNADGEGEGHYTSGDLGKLTVVASIHEDADAGSLPEHDFEAEAKAWWSYMFVRAGRMGSIRSELKSKHVHSHHEASQGKAKITAAGFTENDQESLYMQVHDAATHGKQGLGISSMPKKVAGVRWVGIKTKIREEGDSSSGDEMEEDGGAASGSGSSSEEEDDGKIVVLAAKTEQVQQVLASEAEGRGDGGQKGKKKVQVEGVKEEGEGGSGEEKKKKKKKKQEVKVAEEVVVEEKKKKKNGKNEKMEVTEKVEGKAKKGKVASEEGGKKQIKWHKVLVQILADAPKRRLTLEKLKKRALEAAAAKAAVAHEAEEVEEHVAEMMKKLRASPQRYDICEKFVTLRE